MTGFMQQLGEAIEALEGGEEESMYDPGEDRPLNEFEWERFMKESDKRTEKYGELLRKYMDHPDRDKIVAREMGWDQLADDLEAYDEAAEREELEPFDFDGADFEEPVPDPLMEGIDWIMARHGHPVHPLQEQATETVMDLWQECRKAGLLAEESGKEDLRTMLFNGQCVGAKLAGALNSLACDRITDNTFVVACLKRALPYFDQMVEAMEKVRRQGLLASKRLQCFSDDMFAIRAGIVQLMERFRNEF